MKLLYVLVILLIFYVLYLSSKMDQRMYIDVSTRPVKLIESGTEHFTNDEAIQNIAGLYNTGAMKITNLEITGNLTVGGKVISDLNVDGKITTAKDLSVGGKLATVGDVAVGGNMTTVGTLATTGKITSSNGLVLDNSKSEWASPLQITSSNKEGGYIEWVDKDKKRIAYETGAGLYTSNGDFELVKVDANGKKSGFAMYGAYPVIKTNGAGSCGGIDNALKEDGDMSMFYTDNRNWYLKYQNSKGQRLGFAANTNYADASCSEIKWVN